MGEYAAGATPMSLILLIGLIVLLIVIVYYLYKILELFRETGSMLKSYRNINQGLHSAYSIKEVEKEALECRKAWDAFQRDGGADKLNIHWIKGLIAKGKDIGSIIGEATRNREMEWEHKRHQYRYKFMVQANIDMYRGAKPADEIYEEEKKIFDHWGGIWGRHGNKLDEMTKETNDWIRKNYDLLKSGSS